MSNDLSPENNISSRRALLKRGAVVAGGSAVARSIFYHENKSRQNHNYSENTEAPTVFPVPPLTAPDVTISKEPLSENPTAYGFNTHMHVAPTEGENLTVDVFKQSVDQLASAGQKWIRFNFMDWEVLERGDVSSITWNDSISKYDEALEYAKNAGLQVFFVTSVPKFAEDFPLEQYKEATATFYRNIAERFQGKVDLWQIFNESDVHSFRSYADNKTQLLEDSYTTELVEVMAAAADAIKSVDQEAKTTANVSHWIGNGVDLWKKGTYFFDRVGASIDTITLDLYPDDNLAEIGRLPEYVAGFQRRYNKPVMIGELGLPTSGRFTEDDQGTYISMALDSLKNGAVSPQGVLLYELMDETSADGGENAYGFQWADGTPKSSYLEVVEHMQPEKESSDGD